MDQIESKLNSLGLKIPQPLKVPSDVKTPSVWVRLRGDKAISISQVMDRRIMIVLLRDLMAR